MSLGSRLKLLREEKALTTREMSKILNIGKSTFSNYENDVRKPDYDTLTRIADFFDVSIDYLLGRTDERDVYILKGDMVPKELREEGIEEIGILKEFKDSGFTNEELKEILEFAKKMKKQP